jgi:hypothetical protein
MDAPLVRRTVPAAAVSRADSASSSSGKRLLTVREMKEKMNLPNNYVHNGFYLHDSNEIVNQV